MIASLPMYLTPANRPAHDAFWALVRDALRADGITAPEHLTQDVAPQSVWGDKGLVLSHICNLPYRLHFREQVTRIAGSDYPLEDCTPGFYRSRFIVHADHSARSPMDLNDCTLAYNERESHSGWGAVSLWARENGVRIRPTLHTGAHEASLRAVAAKQADFATIDAWTFELLKARLPESEQVRVIGSTGQAPGMTFITRKGNDPHPIRKALGSALDALPAEHRASIGLRGFPILPEREFDLPVPPLT